MNNKAQDKDEEAGSLLVAPPPIEIDVANTPIIEVPSVSLSRPLLLLYVLVGISHSLPYIPLMYIINTRVKIPVPYLPTYGALTFLPWSLKPMYAFLISKIRISRHILLSGLLTASGIGIISTCLIPPNAIVLCFFVGITRGFVAAWSEFCLSLTLIDQAAALSSDTTNDSVYSTLAARFQSQAATARNFGALLASFMTCILFVQRLAASASTQLNGTVADALLITTGSLIILGAILVASKFKLTFSTEEVGQPLTSMTSVASSSSSSSTSSQNQETFSDEQSDEGTRLRDVNEDIIDPLYSNGGIDGVSSNAPELSEKKRKSSRIGIGLLVVLLQILMIVLTLHGPIATLTSSTVTNSLLLSLFTLILVAALTMYWFSIIEFGRVHKVGLFLILRHAFPSNVMVMSSFIYDIFQSAPLLLQSISLIETVIVTVSSWSYGKLFSNYSSGSQIQVLIAGTTVLASLVSLSNLGLIHQQQEQDHGLYYLFAIALLVKLGTTFTMEWAFLPDLVVATASVSVDTPPQNQFPRNETRNPLAPGRSANDDDEEPLASASAPNHERPTTDAVALEYGTMIACINFGDQIGGLLAGPVVAALNITRENDWHNLDVLVWLSMICGLSTLVFLPLLRIK